MFPRTASTERLRTIAVVAQGGRENAARPCEHEKAIREVGTQNATPAIFGEGGINARATTYKGLALLAEDDCSVIRRQREDATAAGVPILCVLGDTRYYSVFDRDSRSTPGGYGHVKHDIAEHGRKTGGARGLMCKVRDHVAYEKYGDPGVLRMSHGVIVVCRSVGRVINKKILLRG